ncbi:MAG: restriction endonuclease subunit S [Candidimonas sp.]|nr:MAG: restriction endonuclease subunit S [Candidimonas sp.]
MSFGHRVDELIEAQGNALTMAAPHWQRVTLGEVAAVVNGFPFDSDGFNNEQGVPVIRIRDVVPGYASSYFNGSADRAPRVETGDLVIGMDGDFNCRLWAGPPALLNQRVCKVAPNESLYSKRLLAYALPGYLKLVNDHTSAVTVKHLSSRTVEAIPLPLAPRTEQDRIVSKIDELFSRIDEGEQALQRVAKLVERYRQSVLKAAVTGELTRDWREARKRAGEPVESGAALLDRILKARRTAWEQAELAKLKAKGKTPTDDRWKQKYKEPAPPDTTDLPGLLEGWVWASLEQLAAPDKNAITDGPFGANLKTKHYTEHGPRVVRLQNIKDGMFSDDRAYISEEHFARLQKHRVFAGDLLLAALGETLPRACMAPSTLGPAIVKADCIRFKPSPFVISPCVMAFLNSQPTRDRTAITVHGVGRPRLNLAEIRALPVPLPPASEQLEIAERVATQTDSAARLSASQRQESDYAAALRQSILKAAFSGQLVPQDTNDEPASKLLERIAAERVNSAMLQRKRTEKTA